MIYRYNIERLAVETGIVFADSLEEATDLVASGETWPEALTPVDTVAILDIRLETEEPERGQE